MSSRGTTVDGGKRFVVSRILKIGDDEASPSRGRGILAFTLVAECGKSLGVRMPLHALSSAGDPA